MISYKNSFVKKNICVLDDNKRKEQKAIFVQNDG